MTAFTPLHLDTTDTSETTFLRVSQKQENEPKKEPSHHHHDYKIEKPYGTWESPITSELATEPKIEFIGLIADKDNVYWNELRSHADGKCVICSCDCLGNISEWTPDGFSARSMVNEYGGGDFFVYNHTVYFTNFSDQALYRQFSPLSIPEAVVDVSKDFRYADGRFCPERRKIYCVREDFEILKTGAKEQENTIVAIDPETREQFVLAQGADFYSCPRVSPNGKYIVWVQWSHPNMPWDSTEIWRAHLSESGTAIIDGSVRKVVGGTGDKGLDWSVLQPSWTSKNKLLYIGDQTNWWNLYKVKLTGPDINLHPVKAEIGGPEWKLGKTPYVQDPSGGPRIITIFDGELGVIDRKKRRYVKIETGFTSHSYLGWTNENTVYCFAHGETQFQHIIRLDADTLQANMGCSCSCLCTTPSIIAKLDVIKARITTPEGLGYFSSPHAIAWKTTGHDMAYGWYYPPRNKDFAPPEDELPPLLVRVHAGPTNAFSIELNLELQYFTSRGFAILCVDYRGSTRHGKSYRHRLRKMWGVYDVEDCCSGAQYLVAKDLADPERLCIDGTFEGGYTSMACLTFYTVFKAGVSICGISDLKSMKLDSRKFVSHYYGKLLAPMDEGGENLRIARSPINYPESLNAAMAFFHGNDDKIVPPDQIQTMYDNAKEKGLPTMFALFEGEQHEICNIENIRTVLDAEFYFFAKVFAFDPADQTIQVEIVNLKAPASSESDSEQPDRRGTISSIRSYCKKPLDIVTVQTRTQ